jgi:PKD repeat protein
MINVSTATQTIASKGKMIRFMTSIILTALAVHFLATMAFAMDVTLQWDTNADADYYVVYYGTESGNYTQNSANIAAPAVNHTVTGLTETTWYFSVKAFNSYGNSSDFSDEISYSPVYSPLSISIESPVLYANIVQGESVNFQGLVAGGMAPLVYSWNFGAGGPSGSSVEDPGNITFDNPGMYTVTFTVTDANNDVKTATVIVNVDQIYVDVLPVAEISSPSVDITITEGDAVQFEGLVTYGNASFTYAWDFGTADIAASNVEDPGSVVFPTAGTYTVTFTVTDNDGDVSMDTITVTVDSRIIDVEPVAAISSPDADVTVTVGGSVDLNGTVSGGNAPFTHSWDFNDSRFALYTEEDPGSVTFKNTGVFTVIYTVTDADGDTSSASRTITVVEPDTTPTAAITSP